MIAQQTRQVPKRVGSHTGSRRTALARVMFYLALCLLIGAIAPAAVAAPGNDTPPQGLLTQRLYARETNGILVSDDTGISWTRAGTLPSRPLALAAARRTPGLVFVGTESLGLYRSNDGGASWQPVESTILAGGQAAPVAVTALAIDPEDEQIVYAATNVWLGTNPAHLTPLGVAVSVDGGRQWLQLSRAQLGDTPLQRLEPVAGQPLAVLTVNSTGSLALISAPILAPSAVRPVVPAPLVALPAAIADLPAGTWPLATAAGLLIIVLLAVLAVVLLRKGPRPASSLGPT